MQITINDIKIAAISAYLPINCIELNSLNTIFGENEVRKIIAATGIERVRIASQQETSSDMCMSAAEDLILKTKINREEIGGLVFVSQTPDYILPATSIILQDKLGLPKSTVCQDIHYGCSGFIYGIFQASLWIACGACEHVLVLAGDTTTRMINPLDKSLRMVFGDAGSATLVSRGSSMISVNIESDGKGFDKLIVPAGGFRHPITEVTSKVVQDSDGNARSMNDLFMDGAEIFNFAINDVPDNINKLIEKVGWLKDDVDLFVLHQANKFMVNYVRKKLKVDAIKVPINVTNWGNTGPATIPLLLSDIFGSASGNISDSLKKVILSGFGVGLSLGSIACDLSETVFIEPLNKVSQDL